MREIPLVAAPPAGENPLLPSVLGASYANVSLVLMWSSQSPRSGLCQNPERPLQAGPPCVWSPAPTAVPFGPTRCVSASSPVKSLPVCVCVFKEFLPCVCFGVNVSSSVRTRHRFRVALLFLVFRPGSPMFTCPSSLPAGSLRPVWHHGAPCRPVLLQTRLLDGAGSDRLPETGRHWACFYFLCHVCLSV